jgi:hypothetical protein
MQLAQRCCPLPYPCSLVSLQRLFDQFQFILRQFKLDRSFFFFKFST